MCLFWNVNNSARTDLTSLLARDEHGHIGRYLSTLDIDHRNMREGDLVCLGLTPNGLEWLQ
jgi:hypothetical protein